MIKNLVVVLFLASLTLTAHVKIGRYDPVTKTWHGYNPACDEQCLTQKGEICGTNVRSCCSLDECENKLGFNICNTLLPKFTCDEGLKSKKLDEKLK
jgi:hypothetical protein